MKSKLVIVGVAGLFVLGGAVGAFANTNQDTSAKNKKGILTIAEAEEIALAEINGNIESIELEEDDGRLIYDIEFEETREVDDAEIEIDAKTGEIVKYKHEVRDNRNDDDFKNKNYSEGINKRITKQEAINIATKNTPGKVTEVELDDDGYYEVEIKSGETEVDFKISVYDGKIIEKEVERDDD